MAVLGGAFFLALYVLGLVPQRIRLVAAVVFAAGFLLSVTGRRLRGTQAAPAVCAAVLCACILLQIHTTAVFRPIASLDGRSVRITASLADLPLSYGDGWRYTLRTDSVDGVPMRCRIEVCSQSGTELTLSQTAAFTAHVYTSETPGPGGVWLHAYEMRDCEITERRPDFTMRMLQVRQYAIRTLCRLVPGTCGVVLAAMVTGDSSRIPSDVYHRMRECGIAHIFAVSGFHLSVFSLFLYRFLTRKRFPRIPAVLLAGLIVFFFMAVTGFSYSSVRAGTMLLLMLFGRAFFWRADACNSLGFSLLLMGFIDPFCASDVGLQLSVLGTLGMILASPVATRLTRRIRLRPIALSKLAQGVISALCMSGCIWTLTLPVLTLRFGWISLVSPFANAALLFAAQWAMIGAAVSVLLSVIPVLSFLANAVAFGAALLTKYCIAVSDFFGGFSFSSVRADKRALCFWIAGTLLVAAAAISLPLTRRRKVWLSTVLSLAMLICVSGFQFWSLRDTARITVLDVGNASAVLLQSRGESALIGCGGARTASLVQAKTARLDLLLVPRTKAAECQGAADLIREVPCGRVLAPARMPETEPLFFYASPRTTACETCKIGDAELSYRSGQDYAAVYLQIYGRTMLMLFSPGCDLSRLPQTWLNADVVWSRSDLPPVMEAEKIGLVLLSRSRTQDDQTIRAIRASGATVAATAERGEICLRIDKSGAVGLE